MNTYRIKFKSGGYNEVVTAANIEQAKILAQARRIENGFDSEIASVDVSSKGRWVRAEDATNETN